MNYLHVIMKRYSSSCYNNIHLGLNFLVPYLQFFIVLVVFAEVSGHGLIICLTKSDLTVL